MTNGAGAALRRPIAEPAQLSERQERCRGVSQPQHLRRNRSRRISLTGRRTLAMEAKLTAERVNNSPLARRSRVSRRALARREAFRMIWNRENASFVPSAINNELEPRQSHDKGTAGEGASRCGRHPTSAVLRQTSYELASSALDRSSRVSTRRVARPRALRERFSAPAATRRRRGRPHHSSSGRIATSPIQFRIPRIRLSSHYSRRRSASATRAHPDTDEVERDA